MSGRAGSRSMFWRIGLVLSCAAALAACAVTPQSLLTSSAALREQTPFTPISVSQSWINAPDIVMVMQRGLRGESEQRVAMANRAGGTGENVVIMRAQAHHGRAGRFDYDEFVRWAGGTPAPFRGVTSGDLLSAEDEAGIYFWAEERGGADVVCVLGVRRLTSAQRLLPAGATTLDILMRNCVRGESQDALAPLLAGSVSASPMPGVSAGASRNISPLAAPVVR
ncbi:hypothetical protein SAMN05660710_00880 [Paracoccus tibetensis]|uniref:Cellulose biosynthesis protein BcsN n=2 Tax=Paracoccus tibetensis TaxID=336292 RepID=A0A1G5DP54_9RHOB|nr:hypothetical protein SAMN05660710_00880 [Paracoccus tibetensis]